MPLHRDILLPVVALVALNVALAFGAIGLFMRLAPAVEHILRDNVASMEAAEEMLSVLAHGPVTQDSERVKAFERALATVRKNITIEGEREVIDRIERLAPRALVGDGAARAEVVDALDKLARMNHAAMRVRDRSAHRLARAGGWAAVFVTVLALGLNVLVLRTLERRVGRPLRELASVLDAARQGDIYRRCRSTDASADLRKALHTVNELLDDRVAVLASGRTRSERDSSVGVERAALTQLLERLQAPTVLLSADGQVIAANLRAMDVLGGSRGEEVHDALAGLGKGTGSSLVTAAPLEGAGGYLCTLLVEPEPPRGGPGSVPPVHAS